MSATLKLRPRNSPEAEGRPVLRPAGNTTSLPRKAFNPPSKPPSTTGPFPSPNKSTPPKPPTASSKSTLKPSAVKSSQSPKNAIPDRLSGNEARTPDSGKSAETDNAGSQKFASARGSPTSPTLNTASKASNKGIVRSLSNAGRRSPGSSIRIGSSSCEEVPIGGCVFGKKEASPSASIPTQRRLKNVGCGGKSGGPKAGRVVPDGLLPTLSPPVQVKQRCSWITPQSDPAYVAYHDTEWGFPIHDDRKLFELLVLVGAQAEFSWPTVLSKREIYSAAFAGFDPAVVAKFDEKRIASLKADSSIIQHEGKIRGIIENANRVLEVANEFGSFDKYLWGFVNHKPILSKYKLCRQVPVKTPKSELMSKDMMKRGFRFLGPTIMYSFMQAAGMTNDHLVTCFVYEEQECSKRSSEPQHHTKKKSIIVEATPPPPPPPPPPLEEEEEEQMISAASSSSSSSSYVD